MKRLIIILALFLIPATSWSADTYSTQKFNITTEKPAPGQFLFYDDKKSELAYKNLPQIDVKDFGALCNGINDDTAAVQMALKASNLFSAFSNRVLLTGLCRTSGNLVIPANTVILIQGVWLLNSTLVFGAQAHIIGLGGGVPVQFQRGEVANIAPSQFFPIGDPLIKVITNATVKSIENVAISNVTGIGILLSNGSQIYMNNVGIVNSPSSKQPPLVIDRFYEIDIRRSVFLAGNSTPSYSIKITNTDLSPAPNVLVSGLMRFYQTTLAGYGIYIGSQVKGGQQFVGGIEFDTVLYEVPKNAFVTFDGTNNQVFKVRFKDVEVADFVSPPAHIDSFFNILGDSGNISDVSYDYLYKDSLLRSKRPLVLGGSIRGLYLSGDQQSLNLGTQDITQTTILNRGEISARWSGTGQQFGPSAIPYTPLNIPQNPADWVAADGNATITAGQLDPKGGKMAGKCSASSATDHKTIANIPVSVTPGDYIMFGVWARTSDLDSFFDPMLLPAFGFPTATPRLNGMPFLRAINDSALRKNNSWSFMYGYGVVTNAGTGNFMAVLYCGKGNSIDYYAPFALKIPASAGLREVSRVVQILRNVPSGAPAGSIAMFPDDLLWGGNINTRDIKGTGTIDFSGASSTAACKNGKSLPAACSIGECFFDTDATPGQNTYGCTAANTWTLQGDGGGGGKPGSSDRSEGIFRFPDSGTKPPCDAAHRGGIWYEAGATGVADTFEVCAKNNLDDYAWRKLTITP